MTVTSCSINNYSQQLLNISTIGAFRDFHPSQPNPRITSPPREQTNFRVSVPPTPTCRMGQALLLLLLVFSSSAAAAPSLRQFVSIFSIAAKNKTEYFSPHLPSCSLCEFWHNCCEWFLLRGLLRNSIPHCFFKNSIFTFSRFHTYDFTHIII